MVKTFELWVAILGWHDGDTAYAVLDLGMHTFLGSTANPIRVRCALIQAPEMATVRGPEALRYAQQIAPPGEYPCTSYRPDNYGRPLIDIRLPSGSMFSAAMIRAGFASLYSARKTP